MPDLGVILQFFGLIFKLRQRNLSYPAYLTPIDFDLKTIRDPIIHIKNVGPHVAKSIRVRALLPVDFEPDPYNPNPFIGVSTIKVVQAKGPLYLEPGHQEKFYLEGFSPDKFPLWIEWQTVDNVKQAGGWITRVGTGDDRFIELDRRKARQLMWDYAKKWVRSPAIKWRHRIRKYTYRRRTQHQGSREKERDI